MFQDSLVVDYVSNASVAVDKQHRSSQTAYFDQPEIPPKSDGDVVLNCIEQRAARFQGYLPVDHLENLQVVKYYRTKCIANCSDTRIVKSSDHISIGSIQNNQTTWAHQGIVRALSSSIW